MLCCLPYTKIKIKIIFVLKGSILYISRKFWPYRNSEKSQLLFIIAVCTYSKKEKDFASLFCESIIMSGKLRTKRGENGTFCDFIFIGLRKVRKHFHLYYLDSKVRPTPKRQLVVSLLYSFIWPFFCCAKTLFDHSGGMTLRCLSS